MKLQQVVTGRATDPIIKDSSYTSEASSDHYHLSIQLGAEALSCAIVDLRSNKYVLLERVAFSEVPAYHQVPSAVQEAFNQSEAILHSYKSVDVAIAHQYATLVPGSLFDEEQADRHLHFSFSDLPSGKICHDHLLSLGTYNVYLLNEELRAFLLERFPKARIQHESSVLLETLIRQNRYKDEPAIYLHLDHDRFSLSVILGKQLRFHNSFDYQATEDLSYFVLNAIQQLELSVELTPITLLGHIQKNDATHQQLQKYTRKLTFGKRNWMFTYPQAFKTIGEHEHFTLLHQFQCA